jgi:uncharacterized protein
MKLILSAFLSALVFGVGLGIAGMTLPTKVIGFLDVTGAWDPSLAFVMIGAITVHSLSYRMIMRRPSPVLTPKFLIPSSRDLDAKLLLGALVFGVGWGLGGFCPGPAIVASVSGHASVLIFVASMVVGIYVHAGLMKFLNSKKG